MEAIQIDVPAVQGRELTAVELFVRDAKWFFIRLRRKLPYLVWYDDELDIHVTVTSCGLGKDNTTIWKAEDALRALGIGFDTGGGADGRDWEWDWSLRGPINVRFLGRSQRPEKRTALSPKPSLKLVK